eukprot:TRINITY_DN1771_c0_g1_i1.p1 TRINITY_DN1771_c0_g1~~TRINITY_DN1771_c0_g1_i1.p1  ORF type:complete len:440 (-),score=66.46 TRINITY_DN1771_c0_g1_i1:346-1665(-)
MMSCLGFGSKSKMKMSKAKKAECPPWNAADSPDISSNDSMDSDGESGESEVRPPTTQGPRQLFEKGEDLKDKLVAVVVTLSNGSSYDHMFKENQPTTVPSERVRTYSLDCCLAFDFLQYLLGEDTPTGSWLALLEDINAVEPDSVTFNWECCSGCTNSSFPCPSRSNGFMSALLRPSSSSTPTMALMGWSVKKGYTVMCSDFSLKALIQEWSEVELGPNPFVKMGRCNSQFQLDFIPSELQNEEVPQQLQVVGELCAEQGNALVSAMGDTIVYTVNPRRKETELYTLKVLTVVSEIDGRSLSHAQSSNNSQSDEERALQQQQMPADPRQNPPEAMLFTIGEGDNEKRGMAGHVTLTYASGGQLVASMGHWIELTRVNTSEANLMDVAARNFGQEELQRLQVDLLKPMTNVEREECKQQWAKSWVSKSVPTRMKCRTKFG